MSDADVQSSTSPALELLERRASAVQFSGAGPNDAQLQHMLAAAVTAADHGRLRPWRFIVFQGDGRERLGELLAQHVLAENPVAGDKDLDKARSKAMRAPLVIVLVCSAMAGHKVPVIEQHSAVAAAGAHLMLAANALGFGAAWKTGAAVYHPVVREGLGLGEQDVIIGVFHIGAEGQPSPLPRATPDSVVRYESERAQ